MRLGYFTMPLHPVHRAPSQTLQEDREAVILADKLGFYDAFVGEHLTEKSENFTNSFIFLATLVHATERIKLATGTSNLSHSHPALIASHAAMFDHLSRGRFIFGVSPGALRSDAEALGLLDEDRNKLFADAIDVILAIWERNPPYDIDFPGNRFKVTTAKTRIPEIDRGELYKPYQKPRPEIVGTVVAPGSKGVIAMGQRDFHPLSANFLLSHWLSSHWTNYAAGKRNIGQAADPTDWRIARTIFVADDDKLALRYGRQDPNSPYRYYWRMLGKKMRFSNRHIVFKTRPDQDDAELTDDYLVDRLVLCGTVNGVVDQILALREQAGEFGEIVYAGMDWADPGLAKRSMELMATEVMPRVNRAIDQSSQRNATMYRTMTTRRKLLFSSGAALAMQLLPRFTWAQAWPSRPIRAIVPFGAGSTIDIIGRIVLEPLSAALGQPIVVENRGGAGGSIGTAAVAKAEPDGYTILIHASAHSAAPAAYPNAPYDAARDLRGVAVFGSVPNVTVISPAKDIKTLKELVDAAKKGSFTFASAGVGSATHWAAERLRLAAGFNAVHVPFKGGPEALTQVAAGQVDFMSIGVSSGLPFIRSGRLIPLAVSTLKRSSALPDVPTTVEAGYPDSDYTFWNGMLVPAKTPAGIVHRLHEETMKVLSQPGVMEKFKPQGIEPMPLKPAEFDALIAKEIESNKAIVKAAGLKFN